MFLSLGVCKKLETLDVTDGYGYRGVDNFGLEAISRLQNLRVIKWSCNFSIKTDHLIRVFNSGNLKNLCHLEFGHDFWDQIKRALRSISINCPNLKVLKISYSEEIDDDDIKFLIRHCRQIEDLCLEKFEKRLKRT